MPQIKIYGIRKSLDIVKVRLSEVVHSCVVDVLKFPQEKRSHRFFPLDPEDFIYPAGRSESYTIIEISMFEGRAIETKKLLIKTLFKRITSELGILPQDIEITITETPKCNWGFRGLPGDEVDLNYKVEV